MIPPDQEIYQVEKRIAERRTRVEAAFKATGRQTLRALTSPWALGAAALAGFLLAGGLRRHRGGQADTGAKQAARAGTLSSIGMAAATWFVKSQFGSPVDMARFFLAKVKAPSGAPDRPRPRRREATTAS